MSESSFATRISRAPSAGDSALALALVAAAIAVRAAAEMIAPGIAYFVVLLPAVAIAGIFCGTGPAIVGAMAGSLAISGLFLRTSLFAPFISATELDAILFVPACAAVLWATNAARRSARVLVASEARLEEVFRQIPGAAAIITAPKGSLLLRSARSDDVLGQRERPLESNDGLGSYGGRHPDGRPYAAGDYPIVRALKTGETVSGERIQYFRPDGKIADLEVYAGPVRGARGSIVASVGMAFDVTARAEAERLLKASEERHRATGERLRAALMAGELGTWEFDLAAQRIRFDAAMATMLGLPREPQDIPRADMAQFVDAGDLQRAGRVFAGAVEAADAYADELRMRAVDGSPRWVIVRGAVLAKAQLIVGVVSDITERREREDALQAALHDKDVLMREADHRIKNSLQLVSALLRLQLGRAPAEAGHALRAALSRVDAIGNAHKALQHSPDLRGIDIDRMLEDLCEQMSALNPAVAIRCEASVGKSVDAEEAIPLGLIVSELLTNALRHAYSPGQSGQIRVTARQSGGKLEIRVADDGAGLPPGQTRPGLGGTVISMLARQIGASATSHSEPGRGVEAIVSMPAKDPSGDLSLAARG
jgi:two-component sensor histidine kinase/PAS domain-containing protein